MLNSQAVDLKGKSHLNRQILHGKDDYPTLYEEVFAVFERACQESDFELAEDLLLALEAMDRRQEAHRQLDRAYLLLADL